MSLVGVAIACVAGADKRKVDRLVSQHASTLVALCEAQRVLGRPGEAQLWIEGYFLAIYDRAAAMQVGCPLKPPFKFLFVGIPGDCELAERMREELRRDEECIVLYPQCDQRNLRD